MPDDIDMIFKFTAHLFIQPKLDTIVTLATVVAIQSSNFLGDLLEYNYVECMTEIMKHINSVTLGKNATMHQLTTMLFTSKNVLFPGLNHLLTTGADDPTL